MKNDIIRKLTSLTLMSIMVAGGLTFAIPSIIPQAVADSGESGALYVSSTEFGGQQIIEIRVNDPEIKSVSDEHGQLSVTINDDRVHMVQAATGIWYAYVADARANVADDPDTVDTEENGDNPLISGDSVDLPNGASGTTQIFEVPSLQHPPIEGGISNDVGGTDTDDDWPYVQMYDFDGETSDTFDLVYEASTSTESITLTYDDDLTDSVTFSLDRANVPQGGMVHITISDTRLNLDPTGADTWALAGATDNARYVTDFIHADGVDTLTTAPAVDLGADHGSLALDGELNIKAGSVVNADNTDESSTVIVGETGRNTNEFVSSIKNISPINLDDEADINSRVTSSYAGEEATLIVRDESIDVSITSDDFWNSGETATVTVDAPNLNINSLDSDDITMTSKTIPTIEIGNPTTIDEFDRVAEGFVNYTDADGVVHDESTTADNNRNTFTERISNNGFSTTTIELIDKNGDDQFTFGECPNDGTLVTGPCEDSVDDTNMTIEYGDVTDTNRNGEIGEGDQIPVRTTTTSNGGTDGESKLYRFNTAVPAGVGPLVFTIDNADVSAPFYYVHTSAKDGVDFKLYNGTDRNVDALLANTADETDAVLANKDITAMEYPLSESLMLEVTIGADVTFAEDDVLVFDILSFGAVKDSDGDITSVVNNAVYRHLVEETDTGGIFEGTLEYVMLNQINIADPDTYDGIETESNELVLVIDDEYSGNDLQISYDEETARVEVLTSGGTVSLDSDSYSTNGSVSITVIDQDLNVDNGSEESYTINRNGTVRGAYDLSDAAKLLVFEIDDTVWDNRCGADPKLGLPDDFTLEESADEPGTFTASFDIPTDYCANIDTVAPVTGKSLQVTYHDFRDDTGIATTWSDSATIQAVTGTVTIDRNVYPVPSVHDDDGRGKVIVHIEISDPDSNANSDVLDTIAVGAVPEENDDNIDNNDVDNESTVRVEITPVSASAPTDISDTTDERTAIDLAAKFEETTEDSGIFSDTIEIPYNILGANNPIEQSYILSVTYTDPSDATGEESEITDSAIFNIGTATLSTDVTEYALKQKAFVTLVDHDNNYDSDTRETISLDLVEWEGSSDAPLSNSAFDASPPFLRETEANSGIFLTEITIPELIKETAGDDGDAVERGESISLTYTDTSPAGSDKPGDDDRSIETGFTISRTGASLTLDKDVYSWRDRVTITVVAPDFNIDPLAVESVGNDDEVRIRSQIDSDTTTLTETGPNTGIFQGTLDLGGFKYEVATDVMAQPANLLKVGSEDGISVTFTYDEDERDLIQSALIRWSVAEVTWLEDSYKEGATGTLQVIDPDRNLHPDTPDSIETIVFSDTYRGGIRVALTETEPASGIFEGAVIFDVLHSEGNRLQVSEGDIVTAAYDDATLPPPDDGDDLRVTGTTTVGSIVPPLERVVVSNLGVVDALGSAVDSVSVGQQVNIAADLASAQSRSQDYAYLLQIQNMDGVTVHLSWAASSLAGFGGANVSQSWTPDEAGSYTATVFVWESLTNPTALSPQNSIDITVV